MEVPGYKDLFLIHAGPNSRIFRAHRDQDGSAVVLKLPSSDDPGPREVSRYQREFEILSALQRAAHAIHALALESFQDLPVLVLENFEAESLGAVMARRAFPIREVLDIGIQLSCALEEVHAAHVMHKDVNPANILFSLSTAEVKLIDFGISTAQATETPGLKHPSRFQGTLAYSSPEQTGRMNRVVDFRTDFYSLGATLYELLTRRTPFVVDDPMELLHCHMAKKPTPPHEVNRDVPPVLSAIVLKLLSKNADERYQSAQGLRADLEYCLNQLKKRGQIDDFPLGAQDRVDRLIIPQKLYGREVETQELREGLDRALAGQKQVMLVSGQSGIGKTALVHELYKPLTRSRGYFVSGKFDQLQRNIPYTALSAAFRQLARQLLAETEEDLRKWREALLAALGQNGRVILEILPEFGAVLGPQPPLPELPPEGRQNRFNRVFERFVGVFGQTEHPLVLFVDDLQWADRSSLNLILLLATSDEIQSLYFIGAYRDNEVNATHPLVLTVDEMGQRGCRIGQIALSPLSQPDIDQLLVDTLHQRQESIQSLSLLLAEKTEGNPFFLKEYLRSLEDCGLLILDRDRGQWKWDLKRVGTHGFTDNLAELMVRKLQKLDEETRRTLQLASCLGNRFELAVLTMLGERTLEETRRSVLYAESAGMLMALSEGGEDLQAGRVVPGTPFSEYRFTHDKIQQAAYSQNSLAEREGWHYRIGKKLLEAFRDRELDAKVFEVVNHWNLSLNLIREPAERKELARLNLLAGKRAKESAAYQPAFAYLSRGLSIFEASWWESDFALGMGLHVEAAEAAHLNGQYDRMEELLKEVLARASSLEDRLRGLDVRIASSISRDMNREAIETGLSMIAQLGVRLPARVTRLHLPYYLLRAKLATAGKKIEGLLDLPTLSDPEQLAALRVTVNIGSPAYVLDTNLYVALVLKIFEISVRRGGSRYASVAYAGYAVLLCGVLGDIGAGYRYGSLALRILDKYEEKRLRGYVLFVMGNFIAHWKEPLVDTLRYFQEGYQHALDNGDLVFASHAAANYCYTSYLASVPLEKVEQDFVRFRAVLQKTGRMLCLNTLNIYHQAARKLMHPSENPCKLQGEFYDEDVCLPTHLICKERVNAIDVYLNKLILHYLFQENEQARLVADKTREYLDVVISAYAFAVFHFFDSLVLLEAAASRGIRRGKDLRRVGANQRKLKKWARHAPTSHLQKYVLVEAERHRVRGLRAKATALYDQAIDLAKLHRVLWDEALANELAARFYLEQGNTLAAKSYALDASNAYRKWGAKAKVRHLEQQFGHILGRSSSEQTGDRNTTTGRVSGSFVTTQTGPHTTTSMVTKITSTFSPKVTGEGTFDAFLDLGSIVKASQSLSSEIELERLLDKLMKIVIETAGADKGFLILAQDGGLTIEAQVDVGQRDETLIGSVPLTEAKNLGSSIVRYVARTLEPLLLTTTAGLEDFAEDPYLQERSPKSVLCLPVLRHRDLIGVLYLENNQAYDAFSSERLEMLTVFAAQAAISIENAKLVKRLQGALLRAEESDRLKSEFIDKISHELRTPLNAIINLPEGVLQQTTRHSCVRCASCQATFLFESRDRLEEVVSCPTCRAAGALRPEVVYDYRGDENELFHFYEIILEAGRVLEGVVDELLDISQLRAGRIILEREDLDVAELFGEIRDTIWVKRIIPGKALSLILPEVPPGLLLNVDRTKLKKILDHLIRNAIQYSPDGGKVALGASEESGGVVLSIRDEGIGISPADQKLIFESFRQVDNSATRRFGGAGLGLSIVRGLVELLGGSLWLESEEGRGSTFYVRIPRRAADDAAGGERSPEP